MNTGAGSIQAGDQNVTAGGDSGQSALAGLNGISPVAGQDLNDLDVGVDLLQTGNDASVHSTVSLIVLAQNESDLVALGIHGSQNASHETSVTVVDGSSGHVGHRGR